MSQAGLVNINGGGGGGSPIETITGNDGITTTPLANNINILGLTVANATNAIPVYVKHTANATDSIEVQVAEAAASSNINNAGLASFNSSNFTVDANGYVSAVATTDLHVSRYIVSAGGGTDGANYTTIASAYAAALAAGAPQTVFVQDGTYTENITLSPRIDIVSFNADAYNPNVTIIGKLAASFTGSCSITGIKLQTNSDYLANITGSSATIVNLINCNINPSNNAAFHLTSTNSSASMNCYDCVGDLSGSNAFFDSSNAYVGTLLFDNCEFTNSAASGTGSQIGGGSIKIYDSIFTFPISTVSFGSLLAANSLFDCSAINLTALTINGSGNGICYSCQFLAGSATAVTGSATFSLTHSVINSSNTNAIAGGGTLKYAFLAFTGSSSGVSTTTVTPLATLI